MPIPAELVSRLPHTPGDLRDRVKLDDVAVLLRIYAYCIDGQKDTLNDQITAALTASQDHETLPAATAVQHAAQPNPRIRARTVGSGPGKTAGQPS